MGNPAYDARKRTEHEKATAIQERDQVAEECVLLALEGIRDFLSGKASIVIDSTETGLTRSIRFQRVK